MNNQKELVLNAILFSVDAIREEIQSLADGAVIDSDIGKIERLSNAIRVLSEAWRNIEGK